MKSDSAQDVTNVYAVLARQTCLMDQTAGHTQRDIPQGRYRVIRKIEGIICPLMRSQVLNCWYLKSYPSAPSPQRQQLTHLVAPILSPLMGSGADC
jgi:hypothetical protein